METKVKPYKFQVETFSNELPDDAQGATYPKLGKYLTRQQLIPPIGSELGVSGDSLKPLNPAIKKMIESISDNVKVVRVHIMPWSNIIYILVRPCDDATYNYD